MVEDPAEADKAEKLRASVRDYLGIEISHLGIVFRDELQSVALGSRIPILRYKPACVLSRALYRIAEKLLAAPAEEPDGVPWMAGTRGDVERPPTPKPRPRRTSKACAAISRTC